MVKPRPKSSCTNKKKTKVPPIQSKLKRPSEIAAEVQKAEEEKKKADQAVEDAKAKGAA